MTAVVLAAQELPFTTRIPMLICGVLFTAGAVAAIWGVFRWFLAVRSRDSAAMRSPLGWMFDRKGIGFAIEASERLKKAGITVSEEALRRHVEAGGDVRCVAQWLIATQSSGPNLTFEQLCTLDLMGKLPDVESARKRTIARLAAALHED